MVKWIIINSPGEKTRSIIEGQGKTAFHTWEILEKSFTTSSEKRTLEIKKIKINNMKYNENEDINIFIAKLQNVVDTGKLIQNLPKGVNIVSGPANGYLNINKNN